MGKLLLQKSFYDPEKGLLKGETVVKLICVTDKNQIWEKETSFSDVTATYSEAHKCHQAELDDTATGTYMWTVGSDTRWYHAISIGIPSHTHEYAAITHTHDSLTPVTFQEGAGIISNFSASKMLGDAVLLSWTKAINGDFDYFIEYWQTTSETTDDAIASDAWWNSKSETKIVQTTLQEKIIHLEPSADGKSKKLYARVYCLDRGDPCHTSTKVAISIVYDFNVNRSYELLVDNITSRVKERLVITDSSSQACSISDKEAM